MGIQENIYKALADSICSGNTLDYKRDKADGLWLRYDTIQLTFEKSGVTMQMYLKGHEIMKQDMIIRGYIKEGETLTLTQLDGYIPIKIENRP